MEFQESPCHLEWNADGRTGTAIHVTTGARFWITRDGWATLAYAPEATDEDELRRLMGEAQEIVVGPDVLH